MSDFKPFGAAINARFVELSKHELFVAGNDADALWDTYIKSFPPGSNPIYKSNTEHSCSCCRNFVKNVGNVVAVINGAIHTVWDVQGLEYPYREVAAAMHAYVAQQPLHTLFRRSEPNYGAEVTRQSLEGGEVLRWNHFHGSIDRKHFTKDVGPVVGEFTATVEVFQRGLEELKQDDFTAVLDLIESKALYRGEEHLSALTAFKNLVKQYYDLHPGSRRAFLFSNYSNPFARFRNTVIGTLLQDLSEGKGLEFAVKSFETKVAPTNYKRTTALITPRMVEDAMVTIRELGLEPALNRRFAKISDVTVNNVLWVDNAVKGKMRGGVEGLLMDAASSGAPQPKQQAKDIGIEKFMKDVLPKATSIQLLVKNAHQSNFMSLTAPANDDVERLFKWENNFGWSYDGNITDSIREKVKKAGGNVDAKLRFSLAWFNYDDLDIHCHTPRGEHVYFGNKLGILDVDMNAGRGHTREPVENLSFANPKDGVYQIVVNQYSRRETTDVGFVVEIADANGVRQYTHRKAAGATGNTVAVGKFQVKNGVITEFALGADLVAEGLSQDRWGIKTEQLVPVQTVMYSPNYWDDNAVGNKHWFFILEGCKNPEPTRGIYNEFLRSTLDKHRKVFEVLGNKTKCPVVDDQLSGLGFSSTRGDTVTAVVVAENVQTSYNITF